MPTANCPTWCERCHGAREPKNDSGFRVQGVEVLELSGTVDPNLF